MAAMIVTPEHIADIIVGVMNAIIGAGGRERVNNYLHKTYEADINPGTPGGMNLYLKTIEKIDKDE